MTRESIGLRDEIRQLLADHQDGLDSGELYKRSELATERQQIYTAVHDLKAAGEIVTMPDRKHRLAKYAPSADWTPPEPAAPPVAAEAKPKAQPASRKATPKKWLVDELAEASAAAERRLERYLDELGDPVLMDLVELAITSDKAYRAATETYRE